MFFHKNLIIFFQTDPADHVNENGVADEEYALLKGIGSGLKGFSGVGIAFRSGCLYLHNAVCQFSYGGTWHGGDQSQLYEYVKREGFQLMDECKDNIQFSSYWPDGTHWFIVYGVNGEKIEFCK